MPAYHGAEHKSIGEFERALAGGSQAEATKEHDRCGSNLVGPLAGITLLSNVVLRRISRRPPAAAVVVTSLLSAGAAMEVYRWMSQHPGSNVARALSWPGRVLQERVTTQEPSADQMDVARAALSEILRLEGIPDPRPRQPPSRLLKTEALATRTHWPARYGVLGRARSAATSASCVLVSRSPIAPDG